MKRHRLAIRTLDAAALLIAALGATIVGSLLARTLHGDGLDAWRTLAADLPRWTRLLRATTLAGVSAVLAAAISAIPLAIVVFRSDVRGRALLIGLLILAASLPLSAVAAGILGVIGAERLKGSAVAVGLIHAAAHLPLLVLFLGVGLRQADPDLEHLARSEGAGPIALLRRVTLPAARTSIAAALLFVVVMVMTDYSVSDALLVRTFAEETYTSFALHGRSLEPTLTALPALLVLLVPLARLTRGLRRSPARPRAQNHLPIALGAARAPITIAAALLVIAATGVPIGRLLYEIGDPTRLLVDARRFAPELTASLLTGAGAAIAITVLAPPLAWRLVDRPHGPVLAGWLALLLATPGALVSIGLIEWLNAPGIRGAIYDSPWVLVVAFVIRFLPLAVIACAIALRAVPLEMHHLARAEGCDDAELRARVLRPLCRPFVAPTFLAVLVLCLGELPASVLIAPPGCTTVAARYFGLLHYGQTGEAAALSLLSILLAAVPALIIGCLLARQSAHEREGSKA